MTKPSKYHETRFHEALLLRMPKGTKARLKETAALYEQTVSEYIRQLIRRDIQGKRARG